MNGKCINRIIASAVMLMVILAPVWAQSQNNSESSATQNFSKEELTQMLAPIALYPDALLSQVLMAASYPLEVAEADKFLAKNPGLTGNALDNALKEKDWDVSVLSLCYYPKVLSMMTDNLSWTARLGDAFVNQEQEVMDTVQDLRAKAYAQGNISTTPEQKVIVEERAISIETVSPNYIYVPVYDPYVVYGPWWYPAYPPFPILYPGVAVIGPRVVFAPRVFVGVGVFGWCAFNWHAHNVTIINIDRTRRFNRHVDVYRSMERTHWRPDREKRFVREERAREIPRYRPPARPVAPVSARRPERKIETPRKIDQSKERKPFVEKDKGVKREQVDRNIGGRPPGQVKPFAQVKPRPERKGVMEKGKGVKREQLDRKMAPKNRNVEVRSPGQVKPHPERTGVTEKGKGEKGESDRGR